jgi:hypothetical protein
MCVWLAVAQHIIQMHHDQFCLPCDVRCRLKTQVLTWADLRNHELAQNTKVRPGNPGQVVSGYDLEICAGITLWWYIKSDNTRKHLLEQNIHRCVPVQI